MRPQKYVFTLLAAFIFAGGALAQCMMLPTAIDDQLQQADKIIEGKVTNQSSFVSSDGNIYTTNHIEVYRVFKGDVGFDEEVITEGGVYGDLMQVVTPSVKLRVGDYGLIAMSSNHARTTKGVATNFYSIDEKSGAIHGLRGVTKRVELYEELARTVGTETIALRRIPLDMLEENSGSSKAAPMLSSVFPTEVTAGTKSVITITGQGFGNQRGSGYVAFRNANDGGQSFVALQSEPHYLSWTDTEIELYVPSAALYNNTVAGTGEIQVRNDNGQIVASTQEVTVNYAKTEVVYDAELNKTMLVGMQNGGYEFTINEQMLSRLGNREMVERSLEKWACNTSINFRMNESVVPTHEWLYDDVNLIGLSEPGQMPNYLLGKTITTFSGCIATNGLQWNLIEVDVLLNADVNWWTVEGSPSNNTFDMETTILHELGHAHLLQHNNNEFSPMYFRLTAGFIRRNLDHMMDIAGGQFITDQAVSTSNTCGDDLHVPFDNSNCNLSVINGISEAEETELLVFPNPFVNEISIAGAFDSRTVYALSDVTGRTVSSGIVNTSLEILSTSTLPRGVYLLQLESDTNRLTKRLIKN